MKNRLFVLHFDLLDTYRVIYYVLKFHHKIIEIMEIMYHDSFYLVWSHKKKG